MALGMCAYISWFNEEGWKYFCRFVFVCFTQISGTNLNSLIFLKLKPKKFIGCTHFFYLKIHLTFHSKEKVRHLSERKRVLCQSIYIISLWVYCMNPPTWQGCGGSSWRGAGWLDRRPGRPADHTDQAAGRCTSRPTERT